METEYLNFDVLIVGAGPAGLSAAIELGKLAKKNAVQLEIAILEKGSFLGAHNLSGAILEPSGLDALIPDWRTRPSPLTIPVTHNHFFYFTKKNKIPLPHLPQMSEKGNYIISIGRLCEWLGKEAENFNIHIFTGFSAAELLYDDNERVVGIKTQDVGLDKEKKPTARFQPGIKIYAKQTVLAEGCRGSLSEIVCKKYHLRKHSTFQIYGMGVKELWQIDPKYHHAGQMMHSIGWPLKADTYGGSFLYHYEENLVSLGLIIGLDYKNPYLDPFLELQKFKTHPYVSSILKGGTCIRYGARAINEGGFQSIPKLSFPGGLLIGCSAGFVNIVKIKGIHNAMKTGMLAAQTIWHAFLNKNLHAGTELENFTTTVLHSDVGKELYSARNIRPAFKGNVWKGLLYSGIDQLLFNGKVPWTFKHKEPDHLTLQYAKKSRKIHYPPSDGILTFDKLTQVSLTGTAHREDEPCHLLLKHPDLVIKVNWDLYRSPEQHYCPAKVYEIVKQGTELKLQINAPNCIHCKVCDIKDPMQNILWTVPEGGDGPKYINM